jgi:hypothetical protein
MKKILFHLKHMTDRLPCDLAMKHLSKLSIEHDKPIMLDYWKPSISKEAVIGVRESGEKMLVKSEEEYTSPIAKVFKVESDFIVMTENSLYCVCAAIPTKRIS